MPMSKKYTNLKLKAASYVNPETGAVGPQTLNAATTYYSSAVPCKGAAMVVFRILGTNANAPQSTGAIVDNIATMAAGLSASNGAMYNIKGGGANDLRGNGLSVAVTPTVGKQFFHDFVSVNILTHATLTHIGVQVDVEVHYDIDSDVAVALYGQSGLTVPA